MTGFASGLFHGIVGHRRFRPVAHKLRYRIFQILFDIDELPVLAVRLRLFSHNRFNLVGFHDRDHLAGSGENLRVQVERHLAAAGIDIAGGPIRVLCMPRILGHAFNPISVFYCFGPGESLAAVLYEVNNTFGQRHSYLIPATAEGGVVTQDCAKQFYVSPFFGMAMDYRFRLSLPGETVSVAITASEQGVAMIATHFTGKRSELSDAALARAFFTHPMLALKVIIGIHWEALKLWRKGLRIQPRPHAPAQPVTMVGGKRP